MSTVRMWRDAGGSVRTGWKVAAFLVLSALSVVLAAVLTGMFIPVDNGQPWPVVGLAALLILGLTRVFDRGRVGVPKRVRVGWFLAGALVGVAVVCGLAWGLMLDGVLYWLPNAAFTGSLAVSGTVYFFFAVLMEELVFRGYVLRRLAESVGPKVAVGGLAVLFGGYHLVNLGTDPSVKAGGVELVWTAAGPAIGAVVFGVAALRSGGIALPLGLHLGWNWTQWQFFAFPADDNPVGLWRPLVTPEHAADPIVFKVGYVVAMGVLLGVVLVVTRRGGLLGRRAAGSGVVWSI